MIHVRVVAPFQGKIHPNESSFQGVALCCHVSPLGGIHFEIQAAGGSTTADVGVLRA